MKKGFKNIDLNPSSVTKVSCREYYPTNILHDKRVVKGSTHAAMVIPAGTYPDALFGSNNKKSPKKGTMRQVSFLKPLFSNKF